MTFPKGVRFQTPGLIYQSFFRSLLNFLRAFADALKGTYLVPRPKF
jgi:hypothetical protein